MVEAKTRNEGATLGEAHDTIVGSVASEQIAEPSEGSPDVRDDEVVPEGIVWRWVEEVDAGGWGGVQEAIDEVEGEGRV